MREEENRAPNAALLELLEMREGCERKMKGAGVLDGIDGGSSSGGMGNFVSAGFGCKLMFHPPEGALQQVGWPERECWSWQLYHPHRRAVICSL